MFSPFFTLQREVRGMSRWSATVEKITSKTPYLTGCFKNIDDVVYDAVVPIDRSQAKFVYKPHNSDQLIYDASILLDRCVTYRREANELTILGVKAELDYDNYILLRDIEDTSQKLSLRMRQSQIERDGLTKSADLFRQSGDPLGTALQAQSTASADSAGASLETDTQRANLVESRRKVLDNWNEEIHSRLGAPGSAHNYGDRWKRVVRLLQQDIFVAYQKLLAAEVRLKKLTYHPDTDLPAPRKASDNGEHGDIGFLDELVLWARKAVVKIDLQSQFEVQAEVTFGFTSQRVGTGKDLIKVQPIYFADRRREWWALDGLFNLDLSSDFYFEGFKDMRVRYLNLVFCDIFATDAKDNSATHADQILAERQREVFRRTTACAWIQPPIHGPSLINNNIFLNSVRHIEAPIPSMPVATEPLDPVGLWTIKLGPFQTTDSGFWPPKSIEDVRLTIGFSAIPQPFLL
jgi:hypothetical protein